MNVIKNGTRASNGTSMNRITFVGIKQEVKREPRAVSCFFLMLQNSEVQEQKRSCFSSSPDGIAPFFFSF